MILLAACATPPAATGAQTARISRMPTLGELKGLDRAAVVALFGEPDFRRTDPPAEMWQYRAKDCVLDLFFYRDKDGFRVTDAETRGRALTTVGTSHCPENGAPLRTRLSTRL